MDPITIKLLMFVLIVVGTFGVGYAIASFLRLPDLGLKLGTALFTVGLALSPFINTVVIEGRPWSDTLQFGIDLAGGTNLVYELKGQPKNSDTVRNMVNAIRKRIDPTGTKELAIRQVGKNQIEIIIPKATREEVENIKRVITSVGQLEFAILATRLNESHRAIIERAMRVKDDLRENNKLIAGWRELAPITVTKEDQTVEELPNTDYEGEQLPGGAQIVLRQKKGRPEGFKEVLCIFDRDERKRVKGEYLARATAGTDDRGNPCVHFSFKPAGATRFRALTTTYSPMQDGKEYKLAVLLDDKVQTAPNIREPIGGEGQITGRYTADEVERVVSILNAGALEVPLNKDPISEFSISPLLGTDVQNKGFTALFAATICVLLFMLIYYLWLGLVADICLLMNLILLMGCMSFIDATFTLPGLAGIVLTMGMAVDANVLIYERMREEMERGSSMRLAIQNGFGKAFSSIFDSNITTLLTAVILYLIGSDQVKGFAVALFIGLSVSMYTALTVNRLLLEIIERKRWLPKFQMMSLFGVTNIDFVSKQKVCAIGSLVLIGAGLITFFSRGNLNYDIDFNGGTMVTMRFNEKQSADEVRNKMTEVLKSDISLEQLTSSDPARDGTTFRVRSTETDQEKVIQGVNTAFGDKLVKVKVVPGPLEPIAAAVKKPDPVTDPKKPEDQPKVDESTADEDPFAGGQKVVLTFSSPTRVDTARRYLQDELLVLKKYGNSEDNVKSLLDVGPVSAPKPDDKAASTSDKSTVKPAVPAEAVAGLEKIQVRFRKDIEVADVKTALTAMQKTLDNSPVLDEINNFESTVAGEAKNSAILAMAASLVMIVCYIWFRFENLSFGLAAVLALVHDVLATLGMICMASAISNTPVASLLMLSDFKINLTMIAAFLTIVGYSLNDTIVIFDRLREIRGKNPRFTREMVNLAVNQTLSRTILTAGTVFITVVILYFLGGEGIHGFAYAMLIGTIVGCYSTIYVASPFVLYLFNREEKLAKTANNGPVVPKTETTKVAQ